MFERGVSIQSNSPGRVTHSMSLGIGMIVAVLLLLAAERFAASPEPWMLIATGLVAFVWGCWRARVARGNPDPAQLLPSSSVPCCLLHSQQGILEASTPFRELLGYKPKQGWEGRGMEFHLHREWWQEFERVALAEGVVENRRAELVTLCGRTLTVFVNARVLERGAGFWRMEITLREATATDPSNALRVQDYERYSRIILNLQEVVFEMDPAGRFEYLNPAWKDLTGHDPQVCVGRCMGDFASTEDQEEVRSLLKQLKDRQQDFFYRDLRFSRQPTAESRWAVCFIRVRLDGNGEVLGMTGTLTDITERKELELSLRSAREEAESASKAKNEFLAVISHEIRTPMNAVLGLTYLLLETPLNAEQKDLASTIQSSGQTLLTLLNDLLDFSRIESGSLFLGTTDFAVRELLQRSIHLLSARVQEKNLTLDLAVMENVPGTITTDAARFQQVVLNLVGNAIKFTDAGTVIVKAYPISDPESVSGTEAYGVETSTPPPGAGSWICVAVSDTGIGLTPEQQKGLFKKFSQADSSTTRRFGGVGMGLAIAKALVELMGGRIGLSSEFGKGSTFWFAIPALYRKGGDRLSDTEARRRQDRARLNFVSDAGPQVRQGLKVLIAEDNVTNARLIEGVLRKRGFVTETVRTGKGAVERLKTESFDLVLMDCDMPEMDGISATVAIRRAETLVPNGRRVPVIALTANAMNSDREKCLASGMDDFLTKPLNIKALDRTLSRFLPSVPEPKADTRSF